MSQILIRLAVLRLKACIEIQNAVPVSEMTVLCAGSHQSLIGRHHIAVRNDNRIVCRMCKPDRNLRQIGDILVTDLRVDHGLADREGRREIVRIAHQHPHGHEAAVGIAADVDAAAVNDIFMFCDKFLDQSHQGFRVHGLAGISVLTAAVIEPHRIALRHQNEGAAEFCLHLRLRKAGHLVAGPGDRQIISAFTRAVQEDDQSLLSVDLLRHIVAVAQRMLRILRGAGQEALLLRIEHARTGVKNQPADHTVSLTDAPDEIYAVIADSIGFMPVDIGKVSRQCGGALVHRAVFQLQCHIFALRQTFLSAAGTRIRIRNRAVPDAGYKFIPLNEALGKLHDFSSLIPDLDIHAELICSQFLCLHLPRHAEHQLGHVRTKVSDINHLIIQISHPALLS